MGGVALTKYPLIVNEMPKMTKSSQVKKMIENNFMIMPNPCTSSDDLQNSFKKIGIKL